MHMCVGGGGRLAVGRWGRGAQGVAGQWLGAQGGCPITQRPPSPLVRTHTPARPPPAEDMESSKCHLGAVIVRDYSIKVSNYRASLTLDEYLKRAGVRGGALAAG